MIILREKGGLAYFQPEAIVEIKETAAGAAIRLKDQTGWRYVVEKADTVACLINIWNKRTDSDHIYAVISVAGVPVWKRHS